MGIFKKLINILKLKCPDCKGVMNSDMFDYQINKTIYKCEDCGKEWF